MNFSNFFLELTPNIFIFFALLVGAVFFSIYAYKTTIPPISGSKRILLTVLRAFALGIALFLIFEPVLSYKTKNIEKPLTVLLFDNSESMKIKDLAGEREPLVRELYSKTLAEKLDGLELLSYTFDTNLNQKDSLLNLKGQGTDIANALSKIEEELADKNLKNIILVSDGANNLGFDASQFAKTSKVPVFTIGIGDSSLQKDVLISEVVTNEIVYLENKTPVDVVVKASGFKGESVSVSLLHKNSVIETQNIILGDDNFEARLKFTFLPEKEGIEKYTVKISEFENELTKINNTSNFTVRVLKSKLKILLVSSSPLPEVSFLKRTLETNKDFEVQLFLQKDKKNFYTQTPDFKEVDCLVLVNFPSANAPQNVVTELVNVISQKQLPLLFINGNDVDTNKLKFFEKFLPVSSVVYTSIREEEVLPKLTEEGFSSVVTRINESRNETQKFYNDLPPTYYKSMNFQVHTAAKKLVEIDFSRSLVQPEKVNDALVLLLKTPQNKSVWIGNYGLWIWNFQLWNFGSKNLVYETLFTNSVKWLTTKEDSKPLKITTNKRTYSNGEKIIFNAQTYDENFNVLSGADVRVTVKKEGFEQEVLFKELGNGRYEGILNGLSGGDFTFTGKASIGDRTIGEDKGEFTIEEKGIEYLETRMNNQLLRKISHNSNGKFFVPENLGELKSSLDLSEKITENSSEIELWNKIWLLILAISLLSLEWFLRKRSGMV
ncbi:VWA domain-containing protein [bacterium]|nr:VWA domain-containing protein [bacterium]